MSNFLGRKKQRGRLYTSELFNFRLNLNKFSFLLKNIWQRCFVQQFPWPLWVDTVAVVSHLALALSCSLSFYIYCALYWTKQSSVSGAGPGYCLTVWPQARMLRSVRERRSGPGQNSTNEINITVIWLTYINYLSENHLGDFKLFDQIIS